jgi:phage gp29-like protein
LTLTIPETEYPGLAEIINREYTDGLDRILSARENDDGSIVCIAQDGVKQISCEITDTRIRFRLINPQSIAGATAQMAAPEDVAIDPIDPILTQLKPIGDATFTEWFTTLQSLMQESDNLVEFREKLADAYPDLDASEFKQAMLDASLLAGLRGYDDAK